MRDFSLADVGERQG